MSTFLNIALMNWDQDESLPFEEDDRTVLDDFPTSSIASIKDTFGQDEGFEFFSQESVGTFVPVDQGFIPTISEGVFSRNVSTGVDSIEDSKCKIEYPIIHGNGNRMSRKRSFRESAVAENLYDYYGAYNPYWHPNKRTCSISSKNVFVKQELPILGTYEEHQADIDFSQPVYFPVQTMNTKSPGEIALDRQRIFYKLPKMCTPTMSKRLEQTNRLLPGLKTINRYLSRLDFVYKERIDEVCDINHPTHSTLLTLLKSVQAQRRCPRGSSSKKWMESLYTIIPPHQEGVDHKAERLTRQAATLLLCTIILCRHSGRNACELVQSETASFSLHMEKFLKGKDEFLYGDRRKHIILALPRLYVFFTELFSILPLKGNLEVCLLLLSFVEGEGKHHQRGGTNADETYKFYRAFLEFIDTVVMPIRLQQI